MKWDFHCTRKGESVMMGSTQTQSVSLTYSERSTLGEPAVADGLDEMWRI